MYRKNNGQMMIKFTLIIRNMKNLEIKTIYFIRYFHYPNKT